MEVEVHPKVRRARKPQRRKNETDQEWEERMEAWMAEDLVHNVDVKQNRNSMTQRFYTIKILPKLLEGLRRCEWSTGVSHILHEDNDPSHGTRSEYNHAQSFRRRNKVETLVHPAQSPDLNPIEGVWNILKQRLRHRYWNSEEELKDVLRDIWWNEITQEEIQARIAEMPERCNRVANNGGKAIKSRMW